MEYLNCLKRKHHRRLPVLFYLDLAVKGQQRILGQRAHLVLPRVEMHRGNAVDSLDNQVTKPLAVGYPPGDQDRVNLALEYG